MCRFIPALSVPTGRIPPAPDASASTLAGSRSCAGCGAHFNRQVNELLHEEAYFLDHAPS
jgi:hypothetical protein